MKTRIWIKQDLLARLYSRYKEKTYGRTYTMWYSVGYLPGIGGQDISNAKGQECRPGDLCI